MLKHDCWFFNSTEFDRQVAMRPVLPGDDKELQVCQDCGQPAKFVIVELQDLMLSDLLHYSHIARVWSHCSVCQVGG